LDLKIWWEKFFLVAIFYLQKVFGGLVEVLGESFGGGNNVVVGE
jgi:hypothetical protein